MLRSLNALEKYKITATDGDLGSAVNFLIDDGQWAIRYLVVELGFLDARRVLISPISIRDAEWSMRRFHLSLTKGQIKTSPDVDTDQPVSRQRALDLARYYGYPPDWGSAELEDPGDPRALPSNRKDQTQDQRAATTGQLRSANELRGYEIQGSDGAIGHVEDFVLDDETWTVRYLLIDTSRWWRGKRALVSPLWASHIAWPERKIHLDLSRQRIKDSPAWNGIASLNRVYEARMHDYYGRPVYWAKGSHPEESPRPSHPSHHRA